MVIMFLKPERLSLYPFETGDTLHYSVINISLSSLHKLIYGDTDLYSEMIISKNHSSSQEIEEIKRYLLQIQVNYYQFSESKNCGCGNRTARAKKIPKFSLTFREHFVIYSDMDNQSKD